MNRRLFNAWLALGAGTLPNLPGAARADETPGEDAPSSQAKKRQAAAQVGDAPPLVTVADFQAAAKAKLPGATYDYITTGSADQVTLRENVAAFQRMSVLPPLLTGVDKPDLSTTVLQQKISLPLMLAPVAAARMYHPQGALAASRAASAAGTLFGCSSSAGNSVEEIAAAAPGPKWYQLYVPKDRQVATKLIRRVEDAGFKALILTVDLGEWKDADRRNRFTLPKEMLVKHLRDIGFTQVTDQMSYEDVLKFNLAAWNLTFTWDIFDWVRSVTRLPLLIKGLLRPQDAERAVALGVDGIVVSNHGGRRLDGMPATIDALPDVVSAVGNKAEVFLDGGVRRGTDILKALALGARAVLVGRPYAWALAAGGEPAVREMIELFRKELELAMIACGCATVKDIEASLIGKYRLGESTLNG